MKKFLLGAVIATLTLTISNPALAGWRNETKAEAQARAHFENYSPPGEYRRQYRKHRRPVQVIRPYHRQNYRNYSRRVDQNNDLAAGVVIGGILGMIISKALSESHAPRQEYYYPETGYPITGCYIDPNGFRLCD